MFLRFWSKATVLFPTKKSSDELRQFHPNQPFLLKYQYGAMLAMTIIPATLVLVIGSEFLLRSANRWFSVPVDEALGAAQRVASQYYAERRESVSLRAGVLASKLLPADMESGNLVALQATARIELGTMRDGLIELYQSVPTPSGERNAAFLEPFFSSRALLRPASLPTGGSQATASPR